MSDATPIPSQSLPSTATAVNVSTSDATAITQNSVSSVQDGESSIEAMKRRVQEMEREAAKLKEMQAQVVQEMSSEMSEDKEEVDARSVYVGNVDYGATPEEVQAHFQSCGTINRITILCDKWTGHPKGFAYVEFADIASVANAVTLDESLFRGRQLKVTAKRTNIPGYQRGRGRGRRPYRGGFRPRGRGGRRGSYGTPY